VLALAFATLALPPAAAEVVDVLSLEEGTLPVVEPSTYSGWPALFVIDPAPTTGWAAEAGHVNDNTFVFELQAPVTIEFRVRHGVGRRRCRARRAARGRSRRPRRWPAAGCA
jgi:hypothetical protein